MAVAACVRAECERLHCFRRWQRRFHTGYSLPVITTLRSLWVWFAVVALILVWVPLLALVRLFDRDPVRYRTGRWFRRLGVMMTRINPAWKVHVEGDFPDDPRNPYVVVSNHLSNADIPVVSLLPWEMKWVGKKSLFDMPVTGWLMKMAGDIPVDRRDKESRANVIVRSREVLAQDCSVMIFPEGTRSRSGRVKQFADGAFRLAIQAQVPILPVAVDGTADALPTKTWKFQGAHDIHLRVLPPVSTEGLGKQDVAALRERVRGMIVEQVAAWRGVTPEEADDLAAPRDKAAR
jgi:1-acyl-sn-glycerol-3-phosphate acyltransferase